MDMDTSRATAKIGVKATKRAMKSEGDVPAQKESKVQAQLAIATQIEAHTRIASVRLLLQYGNAEQKEMALNEIMKNFTATKEVISIND